MPVLDLICFAIITIKIKKKLLKRVSTKLWFRNASLLVCLVFRFVPSAIKLKTSSLRMDSNTMLRDWLPRPDGNTVTWRTSHFLWGRLAHAALALSFSALWVKRMCLDSFGLSWCLSSSINVRHYFFWRFGSNSTNFQRCCWAWACEAKTWRPHFGLFARNVICDALIGWSCLGDWQPRTLSCGIM